jgi:hypothetical protein
MSLTKIKEILGEIQRAKAVVLAEMDKAARGLRGGRFPRGTRSPREIPEGLAWLQGRIDADFLLPPLDHYFAALHQLGIKNIPEWVGEPENELEWLPVVDVLVTCCEQAMSTSPTPTTDDASPDTEASLSPLLSAADLARHLQKNRESVATFLRRYREKFPDCVEKVDTPRKNEPRYLYRSRDVWPALKKHFE